MTLEPGSFIWATRGRHWGFRFLRDGGYTDPLPAYEEAFAQVSERRKVSELVGDELVVRFPDPTGRIDRAGRPILHDFVIRHTDTGQLPSLTDAPGLAWAAVSAEYARLWDSDPAP